MTKSATGRQPVKNASGPRKGVTPTIRKKSTPTKTKKKRKAKPTKTAKPRKKSISTATAAKQPRAKTKPPDSQAAGKVASAARQSATTITTVANQTANKTTPVARKSATTTNSLRTAAVAGKLQQTQPKKKTIANQTANKTKPVARRSATTTKSLRTAAAAGKLQRTQPKKKTIANQTANKTTPVARQSATSTTSQNRGNGRLSIESNRTASTATGNVLSASNHVRKKSRSTADFPNNLSRRNRQNIATDNGAGGRRIIAPQSVALADIPQRGEMHLSGRPVTRVDERTIIHGSEQNCEGLSWRWLRNGDCTPSRPPSSPHAVMRNPRCSRFVFPSSDTDSYNSDAPLMSTRGPTQGRQVTLRSISLSERRNNGARQATEQRLLHADARFPDQSRSASVVGLACGSAGDRASSRPLERPTTLSTDPSAVVGVRSMQSYCMPSSRQGLDEALLRRTRNVRTPQANCAEVIDVDAVTSETPAADEVVLISDSDSDDVRPFTPTTARRPKRSRRCQGKPPPVAANGETGFDDVAIISHVVRGAGVPLTESSDGKMESEGEDVEGSKGDELSVVATRRGVQALVDLPHMRFQCGKVPFVRGKRKNTCPLCYCFVCDIEATKCESWVRHSAATDKSVSWIRKRHSKREKRSRVKS